MLLALSVMTDWRSMTHSRAGLPLTTQTASTFSEATGKNHTPWMGKEMASHRYVVNDIRNLFLSAASRKSR